MKKLIALSILIICFQSYAECKLFLNFKLGNGYSFENAKWNNIISTKDSIHNDTGYFYSWPIDINFTLGYKISKKIQPEIGFDIIFYNYLARKLWFDFYNNFYNIGIRTEKEIFGINCYLEGKIGLTQLIEMFSSSNLMTIFGFGLNLSSGIKFTKSVGIELNMKYLTGNKKVQGNTAPSNSIIYPTDGPYSFDFSYNVYSLTLNLIYEINFNK
jgi:hypothetical protein